MPDGNDSKVAGAKAALAHANKSFPSSMAPASAKPKPTVVSAKPATAPAKPTYGLGAELGAKAATVDEYVNSLPKMHTGGPVMSDGAYQLKAGEHVLTEAEAKQARKHALMSAGMKSLAKAGPKAKVAAKTSGEPEKMDKSESKPSVKVVSRTAEKK